MSRGLGRIVLSQTGGTRTITLQDVTGATAEKAPGGQVDYTLTQSTTGLTPPAAPGTITLSWKDGAGVTLESTTNSSSPNAYLFTAVPWSFAGGQRAGTVEVDLRVTTSGVGAYDVSTDNRGTQSLPSGLTVTERDRYWQRATTSATLRLGRGDPTADVTVLARPDAATVEVGTGAALYGGVGASVTARNSGGGLVLSASPSWPGNNSATTVRASAGTVGNAQPAERSAVTLSATYGTHPASGLVHLAPSSTTVLAAPDVDPRVTVTRLLQLNDAGFGTPPLSKDRGAQRLTSDLAFLGSRLTNARAEGLNGLSVTRARQDADALTASTSRTDTTGAQGGEDGWLPLWAWDNALPTGAWRVTHTSGAVVASHWLPQVTTYSLVAADPNLRLVCAAGPAAGTADRHFTPGVPLLVGMTCFNTKTRRAVVLDTGSPAVIVARLNVDLGRAEFYDADGTWKAVSADVEAYAWPVPVSPGSPTVYAHTFAGETTATWGVADVFVVGTGRVGGVPVSSFQKEVAVNGANNHDGYTFDALAFLGLGGER